MDKKNIFGLTLEELTQSLNGFPKFRAKQIYHWLYVRYENNFDKMENLPKHLREFLKQDFTGDLVSIAKKEQSSDGSV